MKPRSRLALALIFLLALFMRLYRVGLDGFSNLYYAAAVQSMLSGWHNFFFAAFDTAGFVSVDKPPLGFWIQAISALLLGFHGWALILPQALAGALAVVVMYFLVSRIFGVEAGLIAALILAITPISVATHRSNTPDGQLLLLLLAAALFASKAAETGKLKWLAASAVLVGIGFNVKMMQAYLAAPSLFLFLPSPLPLLKRLGQLVVVMLILLSLSLAWPLAVDLTPASERPYVGSTVTNRVVELAVVHNGVRRLGPIAGWLGIHEKGSAGVGAAAVPPPAEDTNSANVWPDGGFAEVGNPGPLRLFNPQLAGQASWLIPLAVLALISGVRRTSWERPLDRKAIFFVLWACWLFSMIFFFSFGGLIHRYYLDLLAPPIAALTAAGLTNWKTDLRGRRPGWWLLPAGLGMTVIVSLFFLGYYPEMRWLAWPILGLGGGTVLALSLPRLRLGDRWVTGLALIAILLPLVVWSTTPMWKGGDVILPFAGPDLVHWGGEGSVMEQNEPLAAYLMEQHDGERFIAATENAVAAAPLQLLTKQPVMAMGGFTGVDPILNLEELGNMIARREVRFFLVHHEEPITSERIAWLAEHCSLVEDQPGPASADLYDCRGRREAH